MTLRQKLLIPLLMVSLLAGGFLYFSWIPRSLERAEARHIQLLEHHLDSVVEGLIPLLLGSQLDAIHENLAALAAKNTDWTEIRLFDGQNKQLYPLLHSAPGKSGAEPRTLERRIDYLDARLGRLVVTIDIAPSLDAERRQHRLLLVALLAIVAVLGTVTGLVLELAVIRPLHQLAVAARLLAQHDFNHPLPPTGDDEVGQLTRSFATMRADLSGYQSELLHEISERRHAEEALRALSNDLAQRVNEEVGKNREKDHILIQQSRLAAMGEMVHNIAHQWRQPLTSLGLLLQNMAMDFRDGVLTNQRLDEDMADAQRLIDRMSSTIDDFRRFFRPDNEQVVFDAVKAARDGVFIIEAGLRNHNIEARLDLPAQALRVSGFPGQYSQAVLNLLANAKEAIVARGLETGRIAVRMSEESGNAVLRVEDNAGGIPAEILPRIFEPYFTTKVKGSGIGLYMVKMIVERNMGGQVSAGNGPEGACFTLSVPLAGEDATNTEKVIS